MSSLENKKLSPLDVTELVISPLDDLKAIPFTIREAKESIEVLKSLRNLKKLHFEKLRLSASIDTIITFDPENFHEIVRVERNKGNFSSYTILPILGSFRHLEELKLNFIDNELASNVYRNDFDWFRITMNLEGDMNIALYECFKEKEVTPPKGNYTRKELKKISELWDWSSIYIEEETSEYLSSQRTNCYHCPWELEEGLTDEEYCEQQPDFCDEFGKPYFDRGNEFKNEPIDTAFIVCSMKVWDEPIDTVFLKEIGEWPPID
jgi:hypothetical protein